MNKNWFVPKLRTRVPILLQLIQHRYNNNKDSIAVFVGEKRSGKSYAALTACCLLDPDFDPNEQMFFDVKPFVAWHKDHRDSVAVLDEAVLVMDRRQWHEVSNLLMKQLFTTAGYRRHRIILTLPNLSSLDSQIVPLMTFLGETVSNTHGLMRAYRLRTVQINQKHYWKPFEIIKWNMPPPKVVKIYEKMKEEMNERLSQKHLDMLEYQDDPENFRKKFSSKEYVRAYTYGKLSKEQVIQKLSTMGYSKDDIGVILDVELTAKLEKESKASPATSVPLM